MDSSVVPPTSAQSSSIMSESESETINPNSILYEFLSQREPAFVKLNELRKKGWANPRGDEHFERQRHTADNVRKEAAVRLYHMMQQIGYEIQESTKALSQPSCCSEDMNILDLCMAPGGYTASALKLNPGATSCGITLPPAQGGHEILLRSSKSTVLSLDITMLAKEFGVDAPPATHPEYTSFLNDRPYFGQKFQLIFCDGQVLRTHQRAEYRQSHEACRLTVSQLILALQRIQERGSLIMLLHKIESWNTAELLYQFSQFSSVQVFKPKKKHGIRSSFYLIAKNVQPNSTAADLAVLKWKRDWYHATFGGENGTGAASVRPDGYYVQTVLDLFGSELIQLGRPVWETQANALSKMDFVR